MARVSVIKGVWETKDEVSALFDEMRIIPDDVQKAMLQAEGDVIAAKQRQTAQSMLTVNTGNYIDTKHGIITHIKVGKMKRSRNENMVHTDVIFTGTQHGVRRAAIAFMNEYGALHMGKGSFTGRAWKQPPRPFIQTAINQASNKAVAAAEEIFFNWLDIL